MNSSGFGAVGVILAVIGWMYGSIVEDRLIGLLLGAFGLGFAVIAVPMNVDAARSIVSKSHILAVCLGVAAWLLALARLSSKAAPDRTTKWIADGSSTLLVATALGYVLGLWTLPVLHRLVLAVIFSWTVLTSIRLLRITAPLESTKQTKK